MLSVTQFLVTRPANDVQERAKELFHIHVIPGEYHAPSYTFTSVNIDELLRDGQNFVGHVVNSTDAGNFNSYNRTVSAADFHYSLIPLSRLYFINFEHTLDVVTRKYTAPGHRSSSSSSSSCKA